MFETVIGLEVHVELLTRTKMFCSCLNKFGSEPNTLVCPVCLGLPGVLPVVNKKAIDLHILTALALECSIPRQSKFDRKNYFYPDMPKNYQISQYDMPLALSGRLEIKLPDGNGKIIRINRIHLEEDTGKSIHGGEGGSITESDRTLLNFNRAGVPLLEIVSEPDMRTPEEAYQYLSELKKILVWIGVSDCRMEEGSLRCDANISLRRPGDEKLGVKTEIKNLNSFRAVRSALAFEEKRQADVLSGGGEVVQETRGWDEDREITISMRSKEYAHDYRYFPEPDLPPLLVEDTWTDEIRRGLPELPAKRIQRFVETLNLSEYTAVILNNSRRFSDFFEQTLKYCGSAKQVANWMTGDIAQYLNRNGVEVDETGLTPETLGKMISLIENGLISGKIAKDLVAELLEKGGDPEIIIKDMGWIQLSSEDELKSLVISVIESNPNVLEQYLSGKDSVRGFFVGQIMRKTSGRANPRMVGILLEEELERRKNSQVP